LKELNLWHLKLQCNPLAHTALPADFIILTHEYKYLIECKESKNGVFVFDRLTQQDDLINFERFSDNNKSYVMLLFWQERLKNSYLFIIPIQSFIIFMDKIGKKSANLEDFKENFTPIIYLEDELNALLK